MLFIEWQAEKLQEVRALFSPALICIMLLFTVMQRISGKLAACSIDTHKYSSIAV